MWREADSLPYSDVFVKLHFLKLRSQPISTFSNTQNRGKVKPKWKNAFKKAAMRQNPCICPM